MFGPLHVPQHRAMQLLSFSRPDKPGSYTCPKQSHASCPHSAMSPLERPLTRLTGKDSWCAKAVQGQGTCCAAKAMEQTTLLHSVRTRLQC